MNIIKGFYQLEKFRIKKEPIVGLYLILSLTFIVAAISVIIKEQIHYGFFDNNPLGKYDFISIGLALISLFFTTIGNKITNRINNIYRADLNVIKSKYGIKIK
jgi:hypothetical protein